MVQLALARARGREFIRLSSGITLVYFTYIWYPIEQIIVPSFQPSSEPDTNINRHHVVRLVVTVTFPACGNREGEKEEENNNDIRINKWKGAERVRERNMVIVIISRNLLSKRSNDKKHATGVRLAGARTANAIANACMPENWITRKIMLLTAVARAVHLAKSYAAHRESSMCLENAFAFALKLNFWFLHVGCRATKAIAQQPNSMHRTCKSNRSDEANERIENEKSINGGTYL